jgi:aryl-alcohol dehydrogenase-like predicted oxidoreductase
MKLTPFGKTGFNVSSLGLGAAEIGYLNTDRQLAAKMMNFMLDEGVNVIDTASGYETSEEVIGESISRRRKQFILISKCGNTLPDISAPRWSPELITQTVDRSLKRLKTDVLDVMLLHSCDERTLRNGQALAALVKAKQAGKIRFLGYSGDNEPAAYAATLPDISVVETSISLADQTNIDGVLPIALKNNLGVLAKRPICNSAWKEITTQPSFYKDYARVYTERLATMNLSPTQLGIPGPTETAWPELALRFTLSQPGVHTAIIGTTRIENARANIAYAARGPLPPTTVKQIRAAFASAQSSQHWTGQT